MRTMKLLLSAVAGMGLMLGVAACQGDMSGTSGEVPQDPKAPTEVPSGGNVTPTEAPRKPIAPDSPGAKASSPSDLEGVIAQRKASERIAADLLAADISGNTQCTNCAADLEALKTFIASTCGAGTGTGCTPTITNFNNSLTTAQVNGQAPIPVTYPQVSDVTAILARMRSEPGSGSGEEPTVDMPMLLNTVINDLNSSGATEVDWVKIAAWITAAAPAGQGDSVLATVETALREITDIDAAAKLLEGQTVPTDEALLVLQRLMDSFS